MLRDRSESRARAAAVLAAAEAALLTGPAEQFAARAVIRRALAARRARVGRDRVALSLVCAAGHDVGGPRRRPRW